MSKLRTEERLAAMLQTATLLRSLELTNQTLTYAQYSLFVGIRRRDESWHIRHLRAVSELLDATAAVANQSGETLNFHRIINAASGEAGIGADRHRSIVVREKTAESMGRGGPNNVRTNNRDVQGTSRQLGR
jgi:hypothetical protein